MGGMRVVCISDCHGHLPVIPECDLLLIGGDVTPVADHSVKYQARWLNNFLRPWLQRVPARHICGIAGNHDFIFEQAPSRVPTDLRWNYLQDSSIVIDGLKIYGTPWQPWFCDWAFNAPRENGEAFLAQKYRLIPPDVNILISHAAPRGWGDPAPVGANLPDGGNPVGSVALLERILQLCPLLTVFGHLHSGYGVYQVPCPIPGDGSKMALLANASILDDTYQPANAPLQFEIQGEGSSLTISQVA